MYPYDKDRSFGTFVYEQARALRALGVDIDVLFVNGRANRLNYLAGIGRMWWRMLRNKYDLIHAHYVFSGLIARLQLFLPVVVSFHGAGEMVGRQGQLCRRLAPLVDGCTVTSQDHKSKLGFESAHIIPCGVDMDLFKPMPQAAAREKLDWDPERRVMLYVGRISPEKRLDVIHGAYDLLKKRRDDLDLQIIAGVPHETIPTYMNAADAYVMASDLEGSPVVIKEAMACNLPIVSVAVGDVAEVIGGTEGCYVCEQTPEDMAAKVEQALSFGKRTDGREAIKHLQTAGEAEKILELYQNVLA